MHGLNEKVVLDNYENKFLQRMNEMRIKNDHCDVSFNVKGKNFPCHKIMLINAPGDSSYFKTLFNSKMSESVGGFQNVSLEDIEPEAFEEILTAIYTTQFHLHSGNAYFILRASHMLQLTDIFDVVVSRLLDNLCIDYLIETCLFAQTTEQEYLQSECIAEIAANLDYLCMTDSFNEMVTVDVFQTILQDRKLIDDEEALFQIIMQWSTRHKSSRDEVLLLLNSANLRSGCLNTQTMAKLIMNSYNGANDEIGHAASSTSQYENTSGMRTNSASNDIQSPESPSANVSYSYTMQLNTIDVESGAKGWATVQFRNEFKEYDIIYYEQSSASIRKVKQVGTKLYCFEYEKRSNMNSFSCIENEEKTYLNLPPTPSLTQYDIEAVNDTVYLLTNKAQLWKYDCQTNVWKDVSTYMSSFGCCNEYPRKIYSNLKLISCNDQLCVVEKSGIFRVIPHYRRLIWSNLNARGHITNFSNSAVCNYDNKLVVCGSNHDRTLHSDVTVYDMVANSWYSLENMSIGRANHTLSYHAGFLFAIENRPMVFNENEKYDTMRGKWSNIPPLPQRIHCPLQNITLGTGHVLQCTIQSDFPTEAFGKRKGMENAVKTKRKRI